MGGIGTPFFLSLLINSLPQISRIMSWPGLKYQYEGGEILDPSILYSLCWKVVSQSLLHTHHGVNFIHWGKQWNAVGNMVQIFDSCELEGFWFPVAFYVHWDKFKRFPTDSDRDSLSSKGSPHCAQPGGAASNLSKPIYQFGSLLISRAVLNKLKQMDFSNMRLEDCSFYTARLGFGQRYRMFW